MQKSRFTSLVVVLIGLVPQPTRAQSPTADEREFSKRTTRSFSERPFVLQVRGGFGSSVGLIGVGANFDVHHRLALGVGAGTNTKGLQLAAFTRVRPLTWENQRTRTLRAIAFEAAVGEGPTSLDDDLVRLPFGDGQSDALKLTWSRVVWTQAEVLYEIKTLSGFSLTAGAGVAVPIWARGGSCSGGWSGECATKSTHRPPSIPVLSAAVGHAF